MGDNWCKICKEQMKTLNEDGICFECRDFMKDYDEECLEGCDNEQN